MRKLIVLNELLNTMGIDTTNLTVEQATELLRVLKETFNEITN